MKTACRRLTATASVALLLAACAAPGELSTESATPDRTAAQGAPPSGQEAGPALPDRPPIIPEAIWEEIQAHVADQSDSPDAPTVETAEAVTWNDGSLGCPQPGMAYTQALVPGYRIVLEVEGRALNFHASESGQVVLCDDPRPPLERNPNE